MLQEKYFVRTEPIDNTERHGPGTWNSLEVTVFEKQENGEEKRIGSYERNYPSLYATFHPFIKDGKEYALYSSHYTATRVMELPSCLDIAGEEPSGSGFCPVEYYVPEDQNDDARFAFVSGCVWGDDSSWKVQYLDLSGIEEGKLVREERFGYHELPSGVRLHDAIEVYLDQDHDEASIEIATVRRFRTTADVNEVEYYSDEAEKWIQVASS